METKHNGTDPKKVKILNLLAIFALFHYYPCQVNFLKKIIHRRMYNYLETNLLLSNRQGGFRRNLDTSQTVLGLVNYVNKGLHVSNLPSIAVFADLSKAFDSIDRNILLKKLPFYGFSGNLLNLLYSYLFDRKQCVNLNGIYSVLADIDYGVPQGSILGPLLFILFINDLPQLTFNLEISIYADDTVFHYHHVHLPTTYANMQLDLNIFQDWCNFNKLTLNVTKTKVMFFSVKRKSVPITSLLSLRINNQVLQYVEDFKYLGIVLDRK